MVVVPIGGGGLIAGVATAVKGLRPAARVVGVEPEGSDAMRRALAAGEPVRIEPVSIADGLNAPFAGEHTLPIVRDLVDEVVLVSEAELADATRFLYARAKLACEPAGAAATAALLTGKVALRTGRIRRRGGLRRQRGARDRRCYPGRAMKADIHPDYVLATVTCSCGNTFETRSTKPDLHVEICSNCHPFYTGKQKLLDSGGRVERFQRRLERAGGGAQGLGHLHMSAPIGGQAVLEGVMMRGPSNWALAVRKPDGEIAQVDRADQLGDGAAPHLPAAGDPGRDRARRVARDRLPRARDLGQLRRRARKARTARSRPSSRAEA